MEKILLSATLKSNKYIYRIATSDSVYVLDGKLCWSSYGYSGEFPEESIDMEDIESFDVCKYFDNFADLLTASRMSMADFSTSFGIPYRTLQDWKYGIRKPPEYLIKLICSILNIQ